MGMRSVSAVAAEPPPAADSSSWKLVPEVARDVQGIVVSGYGDLTKARAFFLKANASGGAWLAAVRAAVPITAADGPQKPAAMIAFTPTGLQSFGVPKDALATFPQPFQEGMFQPDRRRRLGDDDRDPKQAATISKGGLVWSGNPVDPKRKPQALTVHALLILYDETDTALDAHEKRVVDALAPAGVEIVRKMELDLRVDDRRIAREHFGFSDGISQPAPFDADVLVGPNAKPPGDPIHGVPLGDILLGYKNAHGEIPPGPVVPHPVDVEATTLVNRSARRKHVATEDNPLRAIKGTSGLHDLGLNGSYLVVRELKQDVAAFWTSLDREAASLNERAGDDATAVDADWLAARIVGRDKDGHFLGSTGPCAALSGGMPDNAPLFFKTDQHGFGCPIGSHVRRANPRDGLANTASACANLLDAANAHRILRRGRKFGATASDPRTPDDVDRGLLFMCLNTDIVRQFEFVQQNWMLNPNFGTLYDEVDPLVGPKGKMTLPKQPLRRIVDIETYVTLTGGEYFFLPSLRALAYFETLRGPDNKPESRL